MAPNGPANPPTPSPDRWLVAFGGGNGEWRMAAFLQGGELVSGGLA